MSDHALKVISTADRILTMAQDALGGLQLSTGHWPAEFRAIVWDAVADIATRRAEACRRLVGGARGD